MLGRARRLGVVVVATALGGCFPEYEVAGDEQYSWTWLDWKNQAKFNHRAVLDPDEVTATRFKDWWDSGHPVPAHGQQLDPGLGGFVWDSSWDDDARESPAAGCGEGPYGPLPSTLELYEQGGSSELPMTCVTWAQAVAFCASENKRLPTISEWLHSRTDAQPDAFPWGDDPPTNCDQAIVDNPAERYCGFPKPVRSALGDVIDLKHDMIGGVFEWVWDAAWHEDPTYPDYAGPSTIDRDAPRYRTGGAFVTPPESDLLRDGFEVYGAREKFNDAGFRCATPN